MSRKEQRYGGPRSRVPALRARDYGGPRTLVIDVSHWQAEIDWQAVARDGVVAAIIRLGDGKSDDRRAVENLKSAKAAGLLVGGYRYLRADHPLSLHAESDRRILDRAGVTFDLPLCPDLEGAPDTDGKGPRKAKGAWQNVSPTPDPDTDEVLERTHEYIEHAYKLAGIQPWLYTGRAWLDHVRNPPAWSASTPLWLAIGAGGKVPNPWTLGDVVLHQYSAKGSISGIAGPVDVNHYHGSAVDLRGLRRAPDPVDRAAALRGLAEDAPEAEREILLRAAGELGALRGC